MFNFRLHRIAAPASVLLLVLAPAHAADEPGILWETTSQSVMEGMPMPMQMPAQTTRSCSKPVWTQPPPSADKDCATSDFKIVGNKATWTMQCTGDMAMTGTGEMTFNGTDSYTGLIKFSTMGMNMTVKLSGRKIGACSNPE
jgi:hypothetical protein